MYYRFKCRNLSCPNYFEVEAEAWERHVQGTEPHSFLCSSCSAAQRRVLTSEESDAEESGQEPTE